MLDAPDRLAARSSTRRRAVHVHRAVDTRAASDPRGVAQRRVHEREPARPHVARAPAAAVRRRPPGSASGRARCGVPTWRGAATTRCSPSGCPTGGASLQLGELLHPGEVALEPGESYSHARGRRRPQRQRPDRRHRAVPSPICDRARAIPRRPARCCVNTWEAVYFDHELDTLRALADRAAQVGIERFVLDDGWFGSRRDDTSGLGDWVVSPDAHPTGLAPLIEHVRSLGMDFGIWVEPEMVNPDSDLFRAHPDWALTPRAMSRCLARNQLVLDLARAERLRARAGTTRRVAHRSRHRLRQVGHEPRPHRRIGADGAAGTHAQTLAALPPARRAARPPPGSRDRDRARRRGAHRPRDPAAHGAGLDERLQRRARTSDDPAWCFDVHPTGGDGSPHRAGHARTPPGAGTISAFRAITALFGHLGVEWNLLSLDETELDELAEVIALHKRLRPLLHTGDTVRFDTEPAYIAHGVYAADRGEAIVSWAVRLDVGESHSPAATAPWAARHGEVSSRADPAPGRARWPRPDSTDMVWRGCHGDRMAAGCDRPATACARPRDGDTDPSAGARVTPLAPATWRL